MTVFGSPGARFGSVSMVTATLGVNDPELGTRVCEGGNEYTLVYNGGTSQVSVGRGAVVSGVSGYTVTVSSVVTTDSLFGVCKHATLTTGTYGWLVTRGFAPVMASAAVSIVVGDAVILGVDGYFTNIIPSLATTVPYPTVVGKCVATAASATSVGLMYIK